MTPRSCVVLCLVSFAAAIEAQTPAPHEPNFIRPEQLDMKSILPTPPANDSSAGKAELAEVHKLQSSRSAALIAHAKADDEEEDIFVYRNIVGEKFIAENLPATALLSAHMHSDEEIGRAH